MSRRKRKRVDRQRRRKAREASLLALREKLSKSPQTHRSFFRAKARKGDALKIHFIFSELAVPYEDEKNPSKGLIERHKILKSQMDRLDPNVKN